MKGLRVNLPNPTTAPGLEKKVPDSVYCDVSDDNTAKQNYDSSVGHYLSWQYSESDLRLEYGSERRRSFVTRPFGTFLFYFRYAHCEVGLVIDGQHGYVEGCITRVYRDADIIQEYVLQFKRDGTKADYIKSRRTHNLHFSGNYTEGCKIYRVDLSLPILRRTIVKIACFRPGIDREPSPILFERLILYGAEAPRIRGVFRSTSGSLSLDVTETIGVMRIPEFEEPFVLNYKQLSTHALECIRKKRFKRVTGTTPRNLYQILSSVVLLRRGVTHETKFILPDAPRGKPDEPLQGERGQQITKQKRLELLNKRGTQYSALLHAGGQGYQSEPWILDLWVDSLSYKDWNQAGAPARVGLGAPVDGLDLDPSQTSFFQINIPTKISKDIVEIITPVELIKKGEKVDSSESAMLANGKLGIHPFSYGLQISNVYEDGSVFSPEVLGLTEYLIEKFATGVSMVASLSLALSYPTLAAAPHMFINGYKNVLAATVETDYMYPHADKIEEYFKAGAPAHVGLVTPVDAIVIPSNTGLDPFHTSFFQVLNISKKISKGTVEIITLMKLNKKGDEC